VRSVRAFPIKKVQQLRRRAAKACEVPIKGPQGWTKSSVDPMKLLEVFPCLHLKEGMVLRAYQFREGDNYDVNGNAVVFAVPEDLPFPEPEECTESLRGFLSAPRPPGALDDVMEAIDGDGSPWSYLSASLLARELQEFGAIWHGCGWTTHCILSRNPLVSPGRGARRRSIENPLQPDSSDPFENPREWKWLKSRHREWRPTVGKDAGSMVVRFYTYTGLGQYRICRHVDTYKPGSYCFKSEGTDIATGPGGYVF